ncbi:globin-like protein [Haematococcus lacustris]
MLTFALQRCVRTLTQLPALPEAVRTLATAAQSASKPSSSLQLPTPPLQLSGTAATVATLTWQVASKEKVLDRVQDELQQLAEAFNSLPELRRLATDPFVPAAVRQKVVASVMQGSQAHQITQLLVGALSDENGLSGVPAISKAYDELMLAFKKEVYVTIVTAHPLDKMERVEVRKQAEKFVEPGFKLVAKEKVDRKLQGGFVLEFEDRLVDLSTSKKVSEFNALVTKLENDMNTLYDKLGSAEAVEACVKVFYTKLLADPDLGRFFEGVNMKLLAYKQTQFLAFAFGGLPSWQGKSMSAAHAHLVRDQGLNLTHFDKVAAHFVATMTELGVATEHIEQATQVLLSVRPQFDPVAILENEEAVEAEAA